MSAAQNVVADHLTAQLHSIDIRINNLEAKIEASHGDIKQEMQKQLSHINKNVSRTQLLAPTQRAPVQHYSTVTCIAFNAFK